MVTYGDGVSDVDIGELVAFHRSHGLLATVTVVRPVSRFGVVELEDKKVRQFVEKPQLDGWVNAGFFVLDRRVLGYLSGDSTVLEDEPLASLAREGQLAAYRHDGFFYAMDTYRDYLALNELWNQPNPPWKNWR